MPMYNKRSNWIKGDRRNPCIYYTKRVVKDEFRSYENYGFIQDRDMKNKMYYILSGTDGDERWYPINEVTLVKGHWTNKKRIETEEK
jgi:hypothetical protein